MILLLLFSISSTILSEQCSKTKNTLCACADFLYGAQSIRNAAENYIKKNADLLVGSKYGNLCKFIRNVVQ